MKGIQLTGHVLWPEPEKDSVSHLDSKNFLMENSVLNKMRAGSTADFQRHPEDDAWNPTSFDKPVWQGGEFKAGTSEQY